MRIPLVLCLATFFLLQLPRLSFGQGSIVPTTAPNVPIMKKLDEVEPRMLIKSLPFTITAEGSYYLTASLTTLASSDGLTVSASNVTIDLNGFSIIGNGGAKVGILIVTGTANITIRNGTIRNWGGYGINGVGNVDVRVEKVIARNNTGLSGAIVLDQKAAVVDCLVEGNTGVGIKVRGDSTVKDCQVIGTNGSPGDGIFVSDPIADAIISGCTSTGNSGYGINSGNGVNGGAYGNVISCTTNSNTLGGMNLGSGWSISHCSANGNGATGIRALASVVSDCVSSGNTGGGGFNIGSSSSITDCAANGNGGVGITADVESSIKRCSVTDGQADGILITSNCVVAQNHCVSNGANAGTTAGIHATGMFNRIDDNVLTSNRTRGIKVDSSSNLIVRNKVTTSTTAFDIANLNTVGKLTSPQISGPISGSSGGGMYPTTDPDSFVANYSN